MGQKMSHFVTSFVYQFDFEMIYLDYFEIKNKNQESNVIATTPHWIRSTMQETLTPGGGSRPQYH